MPSRLLWNKYFLYATEFFAGMSVMAIELGASRLLAPYFSSSQVVWTVIIGTIMIAMALGNVWGGRMVDKNPNPDKLYGRLLLAAVWIAAIPFVGKYVIAGISLLVAMVVEHNFLIWASLLSCFVLFVFPLLLLSTVNPSLVKFTVNNLNESGKTVGELNALNTIGSIIGTFLPTFVTIPTIGTAATFILFAVILAVLSLAYFFSLRRSLKKCIVAIILICAFGLTSYSYHFAFWEDDLIYEGESLYNYLQVKETPESIILSTNVLAGVQSIKMKDKQFTGMYYDYALAAPYMAGLPDKAEQDILILGLGTGTYATMCQEYFPAATVEGVEIDAKIVDLAQEYFALPDTVAVHVADGRTYLTTGQTYDVIMVDAYQDITIPFQMSTLEFFSTVKEHLKEDGVMVVNMNMRSSKEGAINDYLCDTIREVFNYAYIATVPNGTNTELFASDNPNLASELAKQCQRLTEGSALRGMMEQVSQDLQPVAAGNLILTDDKAPVEVLGMKVMDEIISEQLDYYRGKIRNEGLGALIN